MTKLKRINRVFQRREFALIAIILVIIFTMASIKDTFFTKSNMMSLVFGLSADGFVAIGITLILISGLIDLSVGSVQCLSAVIVGYLYTRGTNIWLASLIALVCCALCGLITGVLVAKLNNLAPFIITLAMQGLIRGLCYILTQGTSVTVVGDKIADFRYLGGSYLSGIPVFFLLLIVAIVIMQFLLKNTKYCAKVFFIGSNVKAAELAGINVIRTKISLYITSALFAAMAGVLCVGRFGVSSPILGLSAESRAITAAVVGGTSMRGGEGSIANTLIGLFLIHFISNSLIQLGVSVYWQDFASNALLLVVIILDSISRFKREKE